MQDNTFTIMGAGALAEVVTSWPKLKELGVGDDLLGSLGSIKVFNSLAKGENKEVEILRLQYNDITSKGVQALLLATKNGLPKVRRIELNGNKFVEDEACVEELASLLGERKDEHGKADDPEDHWGLDELDELEEDSDEEDDEAAEVAEEEAEVEERVLKEADQAEAEPVSQKKEPEVDDLAAALGKTSL